jgi:vesicle coat complex subunit
MKVFFVKYNDPIYVKMEKLDIMIRLAQQSNIAQVLSELKEYAAEVDVDFVRKAVRAIGRCAIKVEQSAERCVNTLLELIQTKVNYVVQEAVVVIKVGVVGLRKTHIHNNIYNWVSNQSTLIYVSGYFPQIPESL